MFCFGWTSAGKDIHCSSEYSSLHEIRDQIKNWISNMGGKPITFPGRNVMCSCSQDINFNKLVADLDMFWCYFPKSSDEDLRIGTLGSRFKNCTAFLSMGLMAKTLGLKSKAQLIDWIFTDGIWKKLDKSHMYVEGQVVFAGQRLVPYFKTRNLRDNPENLEHQGKKKRLVKEKSSNSQ
ncbi:hypothetical protein QAD02_022766 [Eretmocerus hayati]|uniref:Uncharacterized protein n=1 Tax=Eretmocerus hayati TaxID=131215 RepID=A0ACC2PU91_9HYME|nr:hypothetical protein QAD02_022766 [Eretmocerus hayati]